VDAAALSRGDPFRKPVHSCIVTNSLQVKELTTRVEGVREDRIEVIPNGIELARFSGLRRDHGLKQSLGIPADARVVGIVANFRPMKRHETFLRAAREILKIRKNVHFVLLGEAFLEGRQEQLETLAQSEGVRSQTHFVGRLPNVLRYLSIMDIGVNCSRVRAFECRDGVHGGRSALRSLR